MFENVGNAARHRVANAVCARDTRGNPDCLLALALEFLDVRFMNHVPKPARLVAPEIRRDARQFLDLGADELKGEIGALAEYDAGPAFDELVQLGFRAQQPEPQLLLFRVFASQAMSAVFQQLVRRGKNGTQAHEPPAFSANRFEAKPLTLVGQGYFVTTALRRLGPGAGQHRFASRAAALQ